MTEPTPAGGAVREPVVARPDDPALLHLAVVGDTYTVLFNGEQTGGRFAMIDMLVPPGGGPPPHRHPFDECFRVLEGTVEVTAGDLDPLQLGEGEAINIPGNIPHAFRNSGQVPARLLCTVAPSGLEHFFAEIGDVVPARTSAAPHLGETELHERQQRGAALAREYGMEILLPPAALE